MLKAVASTEDLPWQQTLTEATSTRSEADVSLGGVLAQHWLGFGGCFNELGWLPLQIADIPEARHWFGDLHGFLGFHWHGETFSIPPGATRLFSNMHCANQMFALGPHLGMQCHVEMTPEMIATWCGQWADEAIAVADQPSVQTPEAMQQEIVGRLPLMRQLSEQLYSVWIKGLQR